MSRSSPFPLGSPPAWHAYYDLPPIPNSISPQTPQSQSRIRKRETYNPPAYPLTPPPTSSSSSPPRPKRTKTTPSTPSPLDPVSQHDPPAPFLPSPTRFSHKIRPSTIPSGSSVEIRYSPPKGFGIHSTRAISRGEEILREKPFITFHHPVESHAIQTAFQALSEKDRILFLSFTDSGEESDVFVDIAETNAIPCSTEEEDSGVVGERLDNEVSTERKGKHIDVEGRPRVSGLFERICRINHSCAPNAGWRWCEESEELLLLAYVDIPSKTEITASYIEQLATPRQDRQDHLKERFGFDCACTRCAPGDPSTLHLSEDAMREYEEIIQPLVKDPLSTVARNPHTALDTLDSAIDILEREGLIHDLAEFFIWKFQVYALWGEKAQAMSIAKQLKDQLRITIGLRAAENSEYRYWWTEPEMYPDWGNYGDKMPICRRADSADSYTE